MGAPSLPPVLKAPQVTIVSSQGSAPLAQTLTLSVLRQRQTAPGARAARALEKAHLADMRGSLFFHPLNRKTNERP